MTGQAYTAAKEGHDSRTEIKTLYGTDFTNNYQYCSMHEFNYNNNYQPYDVNMHVPNNKYHSHNYAQAGNNLTDTIQTDNKRMNTNRHNNQRKTNKRHISNRHISKHHRNRYNNSNKKLINKVKDANTYITNLSSRTLTQTQKKVLTLGLKFVPSHTTHDTALHQSLLNFNRSNRLKYYFRNNPNREQHPFRQKSTWQPPRASVEVENYLHRIEQSFNKLTHKHIFPNLTKLEQKALKELASDPSLVIKNADKGSGIVVEDTQQYIKDGLDHLSDNTIYEKINSDPTLPLAEAINNYVARTYDKGIIDKTTSDYLSFQPNKMPRTQQLYFLKKIHKTPIAVRPIVSGCGGPTERISEFIDIHLQPLVSTVDSYIKDSGHIIRILEETKIPTDCTLATIDVKALYLNIPHKEGVQAVINKLYRNNPNGTEVPIPQGTMTDLLNIVLTKNYFQFSEQMYHQIQGTAMGTKMAPAYANLFMADLEEKLLRNYHTKPIIWKRYIDDVFCVWPGNSESLKQFIDYLNGTHPTIKFTYEHSDKSIDFLDLTLYRGERYSSTNYLDIKPFFKKTNKFQYLEYSSAHPRKTFGSLIKGELTRLLRACSNENTYIEVADKMTKAFRERGYPKKLIKRVQDSVPYSNRINLIQERNRPPCTYDTFLVIQFTPDLDVNEMRSIIKPTITEEAHVPQTMPKS